MRLMNYLDVEGGEVSEEGAEGVTIRWLITEKHGAPNFAMRHFEVAPGGHTPLHRHPWEHEVFVLCGTGTAMGGGREVPVRPGDFVFIPPNEEHQFNNDGDSCLAFICLIPTKKPH